VKPTAGDGWRRGDLIMPIYHKRINGRKVWWVRVVYRGLNASRVCVTREAAKDAESELREALRRKVDQAEQTELVPATVKQLFEAYVADLEARGKGPGERQAGCTDRHRRRGRVA
jgi:hypothetical protein